MQPYCLPMAIQLKSARVERWLALPRAGEATLLTVPPSPLALIASYLGGVFLVGLGGAAVCALSVRGIAYLLGIKDQVERGLGQAPANSLAHLASYLIGLPLGMIFLLLTGLRPRGLVRRLLAPRESRYEKRVSTASRQMRARAS